MQNNDHHLLLEKLQKGMFMYNLAFLSEAVNLFDITIISSLPDFNKTNFRELKEYNALEQKKYSELLVYILQVYTDPDSDSRRLFELSKISKIAYLLLNAGASTKRPALHNAVENGHGLIVKELLKRGADVNKLHKEKEVTPLMIAGKTGDYKMIEVLCTHGARDNIVGWGGNNALSITIQSLEWQDEPLSLEDHEGHEESIKLLCQNGSDINIRARSKRRG